ncbi:Acyl-CoA hydrolase [Anaerocolumna jejuensis DSM 15929]|uniref:Acyl-CoA hydrolase n=1 Tax=Anaerocolumna jejuensis DSM 15929 TaxID=1121322 RepID=A0A1M7AZQ1_9FIRM|nr:acyl-CoA thioesterase [Anaerocolumna jejuensis]SHL48096.1 Acyl-CoA hydrolase [Anaerocolumna jejuensis DSM 15929]
MKEAKTVEESLTEQVHLLMPAHINGSGRLFGGQLMEWIDIVGGITAKRHAECNITTAAIDNLQFKAGAFINDTLVLRGKITYVGNTSMEIRVDTYLEDLSGFRKPINRAYLVYVAIDKDGRPIKVPGLKLETEVQQAEWDGAVKRNKLRKIRRTEGF